MLVAEKASITLLLRLYDFDGKNQFQTLPKKGGVYVVLIDEVLVYVGETNNLSRRFGSFLNKDHHSYRKISRHYEENARDLHVDHTVTVGYLEMKVGRKELEDYIREKFNPHFNDKDVIRIDCNIASTDQDVESTSGFITLEMSEFLVLRKYLESGAKSEKLGDVCKVKEADPLDLPKYYCDSLSLDFGEIVGLFLWRQEPPIHGVCVVEILAPPNKGSHT